MGSTTNILLMIVAEVFFLALVVLLVWLLILRQRLRKLRGSLASREHELVSLQSDITALQQALRLAQEKLKGANKASQSKEKSTLPEDEVALNSQLRIANLEKFKDLYFELESRVDSLSRAGDAAEEKISQLQYIIDSQKESIDDFKSQLKIITEKYNVEIEIAEELEKTIDCMEANTSNLLSQLEKAKHQGMLAEKDIEELKRYKAHAQTLETVEYQLKKKLAESQRHIKELEAHQDPGPDYGKVKIQEIEHLNTLLKDRDDELGHLRQECEIIAKQYEELAMKSIEAVDHEGNLTEELGYQMEALQERLSGKSGLAAPVDKKQTNEDTQERRQQLATTIESLSSPETAAELTRLRETLFEKEAKLQSVRKEYHEVQKQFREISQEDSELRVRNQELEKQCHHLKQELQQLHGLEEENNRLSEEFSKLHSDYSEMESRYLKLLDKYNTGKA